MTDRTREPSLCVMPRTDRVVLLLDLADAAVKVVVGFCAGVARTVVCVQVKRRLGLDLPTGLIVGGRGGIPFGVRGRGLAAEAVIGHFIACGQSGTIV